MNINNEIARIFSNIGKMLDISNENPFKVRAYKNASRNILSLDTDLRSLSENDELEGIKGIGKDLASKIKEFIETGKISYYDELKLKVPEELIAILNIQGIGPKLLGTLFNDFGVRSIDDLEKIVDSEELKQTKGVGIRKINEIKVGIKLYRSHLDRINLGLALPFAEQLKKEVSAIGSVQEVEIAGELRRGCETVGSVDLVISTNNIESAKNYFYTLSNSNIDTTEDDSSLSLSLDNNIPLNINFSDKNNFSYLLFKNTGPEKFVGRVEDLAIEKGISISSKSYENEDQIFSDLKLQYLQPEIRDDREAFEEAVNLKLPRLVEIKDIKGDLHTHSTWSDGHSTIEQMAAAAKKLKYEYIAITDHSYYSRIANGLDTKRLKEKSSELELIDKKVNGIKILMGSEVDIKPDGELDYPDEVLRGLDMVVASVHSNQKMNKDQMTDRIVKALNNPFVCALGHPTGRLIGERNPYELDIDEVIDVAARKGKALEVNASYMRLDLKDEHIKKAISKGVKLIISTDAHHTDQLNQMRFGILTARRGIARKEDVVNTMKLKDLISWISNFK